MRVKKILVLFLSITVMITGVSCTAKKIQVSEKAARENVRIAFLTNEEYYFYRDELLSIGQELSEMGVLEEFDYESTYNTAAEVWQDLSKSKSERLEFVSDGFYQTNLMNDDEIDAFLKREDIDLVLAFGSYSGRLLTENAAGIPYEYMVFGSADPVSAGIIKSAEDRFNDKSYAHLDAARIGRQIDMAYELFGFSDIGVVYADNDAAYSYSGIGQLEEKAKKYGFNIHRIHVDDDVKNEEEYKRYYSELKQAYRQLIPDIDLLYITTASIQDEKLPWLLEEVVEAGIPTVAETSESQVKWGAMMHITMSDPFDEGKFAARTINDYMSGTDITELDQVYELAPKIVLNRDTIKETGVKLPMEIYLLADKVYSKSEVKP